MFMPGRRKLSLEPEQGRAFAIGCDDAAVENFRFRGGVMAIVTIFDGTFGDGLNLAALVVESKRSTVRENGEDGAMQIITIYQGASGSGQELAGVVAQALGYEHIANQIGSIPGAKNGRADLTNLRPNLGFDVWVVV